MTHRARKRGVQSGGFTLIEMLAVLAIVALIATLSTQLVRPGAPRLRVEAAARALCAAARATRMRAIATNQETTMLFDLARKTFSSPVVGETAIPSDARVELNVSSSLRLNPTSGGIVFYPGGGSTGGDVLIELSGVRAMMSVNWLTGETRCDVS